MKSINHSRNRLVDIDKAKGLAIFLVVLGHIVAGESPADNEWYDFIKAFIYKFHMPFFMYLSGLVFLYTYPKNKDLMNGLYYILKRIKKLAIGYILFGAFIYIGKTYLSNIMYVDDVPLGLYSEICKLLLYPSESAGGSLWFIYVLAEMYIIFTLQMYIFKKKLFLLIPINLAFYFLPAPHIFLIDRLFEYMFFFSLGMLTINHYENYLKIIDKLFLTFLLLFFISFFLIPYVPTSISKLLIGFLSLPALHGMMRHGFFSEISSWKIYGKYTYSIYLINTIAIGLTKGLILLFTTWDGKNFLVIAPILLFSGLYIPIFIKKYILVKLPALDRLLS